MSDAGNGAAPHRSKLLPAIVAFVLVAGAVFIAGTFATWILRKIVLPILAVILGWAAARIVYRLRD
jgi:hypothetical protein